MAPMSDEERLIEAVAAGIAWENTTKRPCEPHAEFRMRMQEDKVWMRGEAETRIQSMRLAGITLTMPPAPEPTYQFPPMTQLERDCLIAYLWAASDRSKTLNTLLQRIEAVGPEPGA